MQTLLIKAADAVAIASLIATAAPKRDMAPVLCDISLTVTDGNIHAVATDRFTLAQYTATGDGPNGSLRITPAIAKWILTNVKKGRYGDPEPVELTYSEDTREISARHGLAVIGDNWQPGKFPAVESLVSGWTAATNSQPVTLRSEFLARLGKFVNAFSKVDYWALELGTAPFHPDKPGPVRATAAGFSVLLQPNLLKPNP